MLARLPHVRSVTSPYGPGGQISRNGTIGLATVNLDAQADSIPSAAVQTIVSTAQSADSSLLNVQLGGAAVENVATASGDFAGVLTTTLLDRLRAGVPRAEAGSTLAIHIGGSTAASEDYSQVTSSKLPQFVAVVVGLAFLLLAVVFRSLLIPLVASIMNVLSCGQDAGLRLTADLTWRGRRP